MTDRIFDVSTIIVSYNTEILLSQCLISLFKETMDLSMEVIVVDNASSDNTCHIVRNHFPTVKLIINKENYGYAKANNIGIRASLGHYILLLNPDTVIVDKSIQRMVRFLDNNPEIGACGSRLFYPNGKYQRSAWPLPKMMSSLYEYSNLFNRIPILAHFLIPDWFDRPNQTRPVGYCTAACLLVAQRCIEEVGLMDENFFLYSEEVDWCNRMWKLNWQVFYLSESRVIHYDGGSQSDNLKRNKRMMRAQLQYLCKWYGPIYTLVYHMIVWICSLYHYIKLSFIQQKDLKESDLLSKRKAFYRAILTDRLID